MPEGGGSFEALSRTPPSLRRADRGGWGGGGPEVPQHISVKRIPRDDEFEVCINGEIPLGTGLSREPPSQTPPSTPLGGSNDPPPPPRPTALGTGGGGVGMTPLV